MWSKGISWINDVRIPFVDDVDLEQKTHQKTNGDKYGGGKGFHKEPIIMQMYKPQGRFPANLLVSDDMLNDGSVSKSISGGKGKPIPRQDRMAEETITERGGFNDKGTNSRYYDLDRWWIKLLEDIE